MAPPFSPRSSQAPPSCHVCNSRGAVPCAGVGVKREFLLSLCPRDTRECDTCRGTEGLGSQLGLRTELPRAALCILPGPARALGREFHAGAAAAIWHFIPSSVSQGDPGGVGNTWHSREGPRPHTGKIQTESEPLEWLWHLAAPRAGPASPAGLSSAISSWPIQIRAPELGKAPQNHPRALELKMELGTQESLPKPQPCVQRGLGAHLFI